MDNNGIPHLSVPTCRSLSVHVCIPPLCAANVPWSFGSLLFCFAFSAMTPSTMYSPLMPLSRCFLHIIYLPIYVFSLYVNTCSRSRTSLHVAILFGDSNRPTLFICYPGSIEKLTLLGAIYYYYIIISTEHQRFDFFD